MSLFEILGEQAAIERIQWFILGREPRALTWRGWYVGITADPSNRVYEEHRASMQDSIIVAVESEQVARAVERFFINEKGTAGGPGGGENPRFVYAFKLRSDTNPALR